MRISVEINSADLKAIQRITGVKQKSPAIRQALSTFIREQRKQRLIKRALSGETDYTLSNEEIEALDVHERR
jgi:metal-responsive CopG/Arc/MetJ family transcriptional regulator